MPETVFYLYEAKTSLSKLVDRAAAGEEIISAKAGRPLAKLVPVGERNKEREPGGWQGKVRIAEDFDAPLPNEILDADFAAGVSENGFERLLVGFDHAAETMVLPDHHRDPFDRMLIAQAHVERLTLVTHDRQLEPYEPLSFRLLVAC